MMQKKEKGIVRPTLSKEGWEKKENESFIVKEINFGGIILREILGKGDNPLNVFFMKISLTKKMKLTVINVAIVAPLKLYRGINTALSEIFNIAADKTIGTNLKRFWEFMSTVIIGRLKACKEYTIARICITNVDSPYSGEKKRSMNGPDRNRKKNKMGIETK